MWKILLVCVLASMAKTAYSQEVPDFVKMSEAVKEKMDAVIKGNMEAAFQYLAMSTYQSRVGVNLKGYEMMFNGAARYKLTNAIKLMMFLTNRGGEVSFEDIPIVGPEKYAKPSEAVMVALKIEEGLAKKIHDLLQTALEQRDPMTAFFLQKNIMKGQVRAVFEVKRLFTALKNGGPIAVPMSNKGLQMIYKDRTICY